MNAMSKWAKRSVWLSLLGVMAIGCNPLQTIAFFTAKDEITPAPHALRPREGPKKDKDEEIKVLVLCERGGAVPQEFSMVHNELASTLVKRIPEAAKENKEKFTLIAPAELDKYKQGNPTWKTQHPSDIGKKLGADYVLDITLSNIGIYQQGSAREIYEGRCEVFVAMYEVAQGRGEPKEKYPHQFLYPRTGMIAASNLPLARFKQMFVDNLAHEIIDFHIDHRKADRIAASER